MSTSTSNPSVNEELKLARTVVGGLVFFAAWVIWKSLDVSVFAVSAAAPQASTTSFNVGVILTDILAPILLAAAFVMSQTGALVLRFVAALVSLVRRKTEPVEDGESIDPDAVSENFKALDTRLESIESQNLDSRMEAAEFQISAWVEDEK